MPTRLPAPRERDESATDRMNALFAPQRTTERVAQRRNSAALAIAADDMEGLAPLKPVPVESSTSSSGDSSVFASIAEAISKYDKPLVHLEDDEDGSAVRASSRRAELPASYATFSSTFWFTWATVVSRLRTRALTSALDAFTTSIFLRLEFATPVMRSPSFSFTAA